MNKLFISFICATVMGIGNVHAIDFEPKSGWSQIIQFGMNVSDIHGNISTDSKVGFNIGFREEYVLRNCHGLYLNAGILYTRKGAKQGGLDEILTYKPYYVEIPIHAGFRYNFNSKIGAFADFGPYFAIGTNGKIKTTYDDDASKDKSCHIFQKDNSHIQRFDCGLGFRVGAEYAHHYSMTFGFDWGLTDMYTDDWRRDYKIKHEKDLPELKNFNASISFGYRF